LKHPRTVQTQHEAQIPGDRLRSTRANQLILVLAPGAGLGPARTGLSRIFR